MQREVVVSSVLWLNTAATADYVTVLVPVIFLVVASRRHISAMGTRSALFGVTVPYGGDSRRFIWGFRLMSQQFFSLKILDFLDISGFLCVKNRKTNFIFEILEGIHGIFHYLLYFGEIFDQNLN